MRSGDVLTSMQERRELGAVMLVGNERVGTARLGPDFGEMLEVAGDLTFVPGHQDRFDG